jgi:hypothetical protein
MGRNQRRKIFAKNTANFGRIQVEFNRLLLERFRVRASEPLAFQSVCEIKQICCATILL